MFIRRTMVCVFAFILPGAVFAQNVNLTEAPLAKRSFRNELTMELDGKITVRQAGKDKTYPHKASAKHLFFERYLETTGTIVDKAARFYNVATGTITFNNNDSAKRSLRPERKFIVAQRVKEQIVTFNPTGALTRTEMELCEHLDTMAIPGLVPGKMVAVGTTWSVPNQVVAALCELDGVTEHNLEAKLESVKDDIAVVKIVGKAQGVNLGAQVSTLINAHYEFDAKLKCITYLQWSETDGRQQGPVSPALTADVTIKLMRTPIDTPEQLNDFALVPVPEKDVPASLTNLQHADSKKRFTLSHARNWHVVSPEEAPQLVMRLMERGEFVAQATLTPWKKADPKNVMTLDEFAGLMAKTPGWAEEKVIEREVVKTSPKGHQIAYRVSASGELEGVRTVQYFYLIVGVNGDQMIATFSVIPQQVQRLGTRDLEVIRELAFPD